MVKRDRPAASDDDENRPAKDSKLTVSESGNVTWPELLKALREQFLDKTLPEEVGEAFKDFLVEVSRGKGGKKLLSSSLFTSCCLCGVFAEDVRKNGKAVLEKCSHVVDELVDLRRRRRSRVTEEQSDVTSPAQQQIASAWRVDYHDSNKVIELVLKYIRDCNEAYGTHRAWHSPYIALCQSSGWGKSRLLNELGKQIPVLYVSFLKHKSSGFPKRTKKTIENLMGLKQTEDSKSLDSDMWLKTICHVDTLFYNLHDKHKNMINLDTLKFKWDELKELPTKDVKLKHDLIVVAFDEANELLREKQTLFRATGHLLQELHDLTENKVFGIMADTNSRVFNFAPKVTDDPSAKSIENPPDLFQPFVVGGFNSCFELKDNSNWRRPHSMLGYGRPLWGAYFSQQLNDPKKWKPELVADYAATKLFGRRLPNKWSSKLYLQSISCMFARLGIYLSPNSSATWSLAARHMATLIAVSNDRETILVTYISEPVLAMGAAFLWARKSLLVDHLLPSLRHAFMQGLVLEGSLGETVACILLLLIMDKMSDKNYYHGDFFLLDAFLQQLGAKKEDVEKLTNKVLASTKIGFGHFVLWHRDITKKDLSVLLRLRAAVILKRGQKGADLLLPLWWDESAESGNRNTEYGFVLVQVKNRVQAANTVEAGHKLSNDFVFETDCEMKNLFSVKVLMDFGLAAQKKNYTTCQQVALVEEDEGHVVERNDNASSRIRKEETIKQTARNPNKQFSTDDNFYMLSIRGFDHLHLTKNVKGKEEGINESMKGKTRESEATEIEEHEDIKVEESEVNETGESDKSEIDESDESDKSEADESDKGAGDESDKGETDDSDKGEADESDKGEADKNDDALEIENNVKNSLRSLLVGSTKARTWCEAECWVKKREIDVVPPYFLENMLAEDEPQQ